MNFNKLIDIELVTKNRKITLKTPRRGCKPDISVSGNLTMASMAFNFEVRITNLYMEGIEDATAITVSAGYEGMMSAGIRGQVQNVYVEKPAPDKVVVLSCLTASYDELVNKTVDLKLDAGFTLEEAVSRVKDALSFESYSIDSALSGKSCPAPLAVNGRCSDAIAEIKKAFPGVGISAAGKKLSVYPLDSARKTVTLHKLGILTQPPQFSGGEVNLSLPWNPMIKPGDYVRFPVTFSKSDFGAIKSDTAMVCSVQFTFATNEDVNEMMITGTTVKALKESVAE